MIKMFHLLILSVCILTAATTSIPTKKTAVKSINPRIINGQPAELGQFPWQAALYITGLDLSVWFCGGSIISTDWILTAAHCVQGGATARILTGAIALNGETTESRSLEFIPHKGFNPKTLEHDIGLLKLLQPLVFTDTIKPIRLATDLLESDINFRVSGFGKTSDGGTISLTLNFVDLVTITTVECEKTYGKGEVFDGIVCATSGSSAIKSTCLGDSGGPAVIINADSEPVHIATVSFVSNTGCATGAPSGYSRTAYYREWIRDNSGV